MSSWYLAMTLCSGQRVYALRKLGEFAKRTTLDKNPEICKGVLERLLKIKIDHIEYPELQKNISPFYEKKGVRLDVFVADSERVFDVECQTYKIAAIGKRTRYYQSMIDIDSLLKGTFYSDLKESYVIFICTDDPFKQNLPVYTFERVCREDETVSLNDKTHHLIFNAAAYDKENDAELKAFLAFVKNNTAETDFTREVANMVQTKKFEQTFINEYLAWNLHDKDVEMRGKQAGILEGRKETARNLLALNMSAETIAKATGLSVEEVREIDSRT